MRKQVLAVAGALLVAAFVPAGSQAQQATQAKIMFAFQVGNKVMPAGEYRIDRALPDRAEVQRIRRTDSSAETVALTVGVDPSDKKAGPVLIFHCYSGECFLSEIWTGSDVARRLPPTAREKELSRASAEKQLAVIVVPLKVAS
jgi:hypothetical protein